MGNITGAGSSPPIPKSQLIRILKRARKLGLRRMLLLKKENMEARLPIYKVDAQKYRHAIFEGMQAQQKMCQDTVLEICNEQNVTTDSFTSSLRNHMMDPEVNELFLSFQTISGDICENYPVPEEFDIDKLKEGMRIQIREFASYPINDASTSIIAQIAACDEVFQVLGIDEISFGALAIKFEKSTDEELAQLKEEWNKASKFDLNLVRPNPS